MKDTSQASRVPSSAESSQVEFNAEKDLNTESLRLAYDLAVATHDLTERRLDALEKRLQDILMFGVTASVALIALLSNVPTEKFGSYMFVLAVVCFAAAVVIGGSARIAGNWKVIHASDLYNKFIQLSEKEFRRQIIYFAGVAQSTNLDRLNRKSQLIGLTGVAFILEFVFLALWAILVVSPL